jgi:hypothetical protein
MKSRAGLSLPATLTIAFLALSVAALLVSGSLQIFSNIQTQQENIASQQRLGAQLAAKTVSDFVQRVGAGGDAGGGGRAAAGIGHRADRVGDA